MLYVTIMAASPCHSVDIDDALKIIGSIGEEEFDALLKGESKKETDDVIDKMITDYFDKKYDLDYFCDNIPHYETLMKLTGKCWKETMISRVFPLPLTDVNIYRKRDLIFLLGHYADEMLPLTVKAQFYFWLNILEGIHIDKEAYHVMTNLFDSDAVSIESLWKESTDKELITMDDYIDAVKEFTDGDYLLRLLIKLISRKDIKLDSIKELIKVDMENIKKGLLLDRIHDNSSVENIIKYVIDNFEIRDLFELTHLSCSLQGRFAHEVMLECIKRKNVILQKEDITQISLDMIVMKFYAIMGLVSPDAHGVLIHRYLSGRVLAGMIPDANRMSILASEYIKSGEVFDDDKMMSALTKYSKLTVDIVKVSRRKVPCEMLCLLYNNDIKDITQHYDFSGDWLGKFIDVMNMRDIDKLKSILRYSKPPLNDCTLDVNKIIDRLYKEGVKAHLDPSVFLAFKRFYPRLKVLYDMQKTNDKVNDINKLVMINTGYRTLSLVYDDLPDVYIDVTDARYIDAILNTKKMNFIEDMINLLNSLDYDIDVTYDHGKINHKIYDKEKNEERIPVIERCALCLTDIDRIKVIMCKYNHYHCVCCAPTLRECCICVHKCSFD